MRVMKTGSYRRLALLSALGLLLADGRPLNAEGLPEPDLVMYGVVRNVRSSANIRIGYGTLTWVFQPTNGETPIVLSTILTNIEDQFSYILRVPCETEVAGFSVSSNVIKLSTAGIAFNRSQVSWAGNALTFVQPALATTSFGATDRGRIERIDLDLSVPILDLDGNGLPDDWERLYYGRTGIDPFADPDRDGMNNLAEYKAGTNPNDASSSLRFIEIRAVQGAVRLKWSSVADRKYVLQRSGNLSGSFLDMASGILATPTANTYLDTTATGAGPYFYRLRLEDVFSLVEPFKFTGIRRDPLGGISVDWLSNSNQLYTLQRSSNLSAGFTILRANIAATPPLNSLRDTNALGLGPYFYRLRLEP